MHDQDRGLSELGQRDRAMGRFALGDLRPGGRMESRGDVAGALELFRQPGDAIGVFRVNHDQRALAFGERQHVENLAVAQLERIVGHVDLE